MIISQARSIGSIGLPVYTKDKQLKMLPININRHNNLPSGFEEYYDTLKSLLEYVPRKAGPNKTAYLTIDSKKILPGETHRRGGPHIDGNYSIKGWNNPRPTWNNPTPIIPQPSWAPPAPKWNDPKDTGGGMIIVSDYPLCKGWIGEFDTNPGEGGDLSHIQDTLDKQDSFILARNIIYLGNSQFVHESIPTNRSVYRTLIRLTLDENLKVFNN